MKYEIIIYTDARGRAPLRDYLKEKKSQKDNDSRIRSSKIQDYISLLQEKVLCYQSQYASIFRTKSIPGCGNFGRVVTRYYFFAWTCGAFVLLHAFRKQSQKTPDSELHKAEREYKDWIERNGKI